MAQFYVNNGVCEAFDDLTGECTVRRLYDPETDANVPDILVYKKAWARKRLAGIRYDHETSGIAYGDYVVATDRQSQSLLTGALVVAPETPIFWKMVDGTFVQVVPRKLAIIVAAHVASCFATEARLAVSIENASTVEELDAIEMDFTGN